MTTLVRLGDIGNAYGGLTGKIKTDFGSGDARYITFLEVINSTRLRGLSLEKVRVAKGEHQNRVLRGDLLFNGSSETPEEVALSAVVDFDPDRRTYLNSFCFGFRLRPDAPVDSTYLAYFFRSHAGRSLIASLAQGATRYNLAKTKFLELRLPLPSLDLQREVVESLNDAEDLFALLNRMITKKRHIKQGMMQELLTGRTRLPGSSGDWTLRKFEDLVTPGKQRKLPGEVFPATLLIELEQMESGTGRILADATADSATSLKTVFMEGDILFGKLRAYLRKYWLATAGGLCSTEIWALRPKPGVSSGFVRYVVESDKFIDVASGAYGTHMPRSDWGTVGRYQIQVPGPTEQAAIAAVLGEADREIELLIALRTKADAIKQGMMQELLAGRTRLRVPEVVA